MPLYEFECELGHITETLFSLGNCPTKIICPFIEYKDKDNTTILSCNLLAEKIWSQPANIQIGKPTKIFYNEKTGEAQMPMSSTDQAPYGFVEKELKGPIERSKFEKEDNERARVLDELETYRIDIRRQSHQKVRQDDLRAKMNALQTEYHPDYGDPNSPHKNEKVDHFLTDKSKALLKKSMEHTSKKRVPKKVSERHLAVNHQNSSNMQDAPQGK